MTNNFRKFDRSVVESETTLFSGQIFEVTQRDFHLNGKRLQFEYARRSPGVRILVRSNNKILLTREFRYELNGYDYRLPGGKVFDSVSDYQAARVHENSMETAAFDAACRELREEAGIEAVNLRLLKKSVCGATVEWDIYYFECSEWKSVEQCLDLGEDIRPVWLGHERVLKLCLDGGISEDRTVGVVLRFMLSEFSDDSE